HRIIAACPQIHLVDDEILHCVACRHGHPRFSDPLGDNPLTIPAFPAILTAMPDRRVNLHLVSDATGETLNAIVRATTVQFEHAEIFYHRWSLIRTRFQLHRVIEGIEHEPGPVLSTLVDRAL